MLPIHREPDVTAVRKLFQQLGLVKLRWRPAMCSTISSQLTTTLKTIGRSLSFFDVYIEMYIFFEIVCIYVALYA